MDRRIYAMEYHDLNRIEKLNQLECVETFWDDVRKLCKNVHSDHSIKRWQILAENRFEELLNGSEV